MMSDTKAITIPIDGLPGLREFARDWLGFNPWRITGRGRNDAWVDIESDAGFWLPIHIPAGMDLGARYLANIHGLDTSNGYIWYWAVGYGHAVSRWELRAATGPRAKRTIRCYRHADMPGDWLTVVPALADIPDECVYCNGAGPYSPSHMQSICPACNGTGKTPQRAALALEACILHVVGER